jgi:hypothetical protein
MVTTAVAMQHPNGGNGIESILKSYRDRPWMPELRKKLRAALQEWEQGQVEDGKLDPGPSYFLLKRSQETGYITVSRQVPQWPLTPRLAQCGTFLGTWMGIDLYHRAPVGGPADLVAWYSTDPRGYYTCGVNERDLNLAHPALAVAKARLYDQDDPTAGLDYAAEDDRLADLDELVDQLQERLAAKHQPLVIEKDPDGDAPWEVHGQYDPLEGECPTPLGTGTTLRAAVRAALGSLDD